MLSQSYQPECNSTEEKGIIIEKNELLKQGTGQQSEYYR
jgi:hypothetical protein